MLFLGTVDQMFVYWWWLGSYMFIRYHGPCVVICCSLRPSSLVSTVFLCSNLTRFLHDAYDGVSAQSGLLAYSLPSDEYPHAMIVADVENLRIPVFMRIKGDLRVRDRHSCVADFLVADPFESF